jgi:transcriptional regulator with XRE-family HTH domain
MQTIGERLEEARKKKGISIREAAEATKIRSDYLQKFESNQFDIGLTDIYARGFLRTYANFLKLPADRILNDFSALGRGETRPRPSAREIYGRMDISTTAPNDPTDRSGGVDEKAAPSTAETSRPTPRPAPQRHRTGSSLPTGPDPAVVFKYVKIGGAVAAVIVVIIVGWVMLSNRSGAEPRSAANPPAATNAGTPAAPTAPAATPTITLIAKDAVHVTINRQNPDGTVGEEIYKGLLSRGDRRVVPKPGAIWITTTAAQNLSVEVPGWKEPLDVIVDGRRMTGFAQFGLP